MSTQYFLVAIFICKSSVFLLFWHAKKNSHDFKNWAYLKNTKQKALSEGDKGHSQSNNAGQEDPIDEGGEDNGVIGNPPGKINFGKKSNQKRNPRDPTWEDG